MTAIINILATQNLKSDFPRQHYEFYLAHKILEHPDIYSKVYEGDSYKIVDCSACELGVGVDMNSVLRAANIVGASEIILPDIVKSDNSLDISLKALNSLNQYQLNKYNIAIVIQGSTLQTALQSVRRLCTDHDAMVLIDTIMIPKWFSTRSRTVLTQEVQKLAPKKMIHWLGLGDDIAYCIAKAKQLGIRSMDTGYFISIAQKGMDNVVKLERNHYHTIDLEKNKLKPADILNVINITNNYNFNGSECSILTDWKDRKFADTMRKISTIMLILAFLLCFLKVFNLI